MKKSLFLLVMAWGAFCFVSSSSFAHETVTVHLKKTVQSIAVRGNVSVPTKVITPAIHVKVGSYLNERAVLRDVRRIKRIGEFSSVKVKKIAVPGGVNLVYFVKEIDEIVQAIKIKGNIKTRQDEIRSVLSLGEGNKYSYALIQEDISKIYATGQFERVEVVKRNIPGGLELTYVLTELPVLSGVSPSGKFGPVQFRTLPSKPGVPYVESSSIPGFTDREMKLFHGQGAPDYYKGKFDSGSHRGPLTLGIGATHNFLGSK